MKKTLIFVAWLSLAYGTPFPFHPVPGIPEDGSRIMSQTKCDLSIADSCYGKLALSLGFPSFPADVQQFLSALNQIYQHEGVTGFDRVCSAYVGLMECLGPLYSECVTVPTLLQMGLSSLNAVTYVSISHQYQFQCGPAKQVLEHSFECLMSTAKSEETTLSACVTKLNTQLQTDYKHACDHVKEFTRCYTAPFSRACGNPAGWAVCASIAKSWEVTMPSCKTSCTMNADGTGPVKDGAIITETKPEKQIVQPRTYLEHVELARKPIDVVLSGKVKIYGPHMRPLVQLPMSLSREVPQTELSGATCDAQKFKTCLNAYTTGIGMGKFTTVTAFIDYLHKYVTSQEHFANLCKEGKEFHDCVGPNYESCFSPSFLSSQGLSPSEILQVRAVKNELDYECGPGYNVFYKNFQCFVSTAEKHKDALAQCVKTFTTSVMKDPTKVCKYAQVFIDCETRIYGEECPKDADQAFCTLFKIGLGTTLPQCSLKCP